jgi:hypothetical protein
VLRQAPGTAAARDEADGRRIRRGRHGDIIAAAASRPPPPQRAGT